MQATNRASFRYQLRLLKLKLNLSVVINQNSFLNVCNMFTKAASEITLLGNYPSCDIRTYIEWLVSYFK